MGYTKLFTEIIMSTVWREPNHVRLLWITMLALKDRWHVVNASIPGLADSARISMDECIEALTILSEPDEFSRTKDFDGRRIETCDGGWIILNGEKYRNKMSLDERREYQRIKQKEYRDRKRSVKSCLQSSQQFTHTDTDTNTESSKKNTSSSDEIYVTKKNRKLKNDQLTGFLKFWSTFNYKTGKAEAADSWLDLKVTTSQLTEILKGAKAEASRRPDMKKKGQTPKMAQGWLSGRRWEDESPQSAGQGYGGGAL